MTDFLNTLFTVVIVPLLGVLTGYLVQLIRNKSKELKVKVNNEMYDKYINLATDAITKAVIDTNQTYVDKLKGANTFSKEAQLEALNKSINTAIDIMDNSAKEFLTEAIYDFDKWIQTMVENIVVKLKKTDEGTNTAIWS